MLHATQLSCLLPRTPPVKVAHYGHCVGACVYPPIVFYFLFFAFEPNGKRQAELQVVDLVCGLWLAFSYTARTAKDIFALPIKEIGQ